MHGDEVQAEVERVLADAEDQCRHIEREHEQRQQQAANELALLESWLAAQRAYDRLPAVSAAIVHDQELLWRGAFGYADTERKQPAAADTIYGICSISKLFTGIAVMQLRDRGKSILFILHKMR